MARIAAIALAVLLLMLVGTPTPYAGTGGSLDQVNVYKARVTCEPNQTSTIITILLDLPSPGYKLIKKNVTQNGSSVLIDLWFSKPSQPVIQVITSWGTTLEVNGTVTHVKLRVNGTTVYEGPCGETQNQLEDKEENTTTTGAISPSWKDSTQDKTESSTANNRLGLVAVGLGIALAGAALIGITLRK